MIPVSPAWRAFQKSVTVHAHLPMWAGDFNLGALDVLKGSELAMAEDLLCERLVDHPDPRVPRALARVKSEFAIPVLQAAIVQYEDEGAFCVEAARALWTICADEGVIAVLVTVLAADQSPEARVRAAHALSERPEDEALRALFAGLSDPDDAVRSAVVDALWLKLDLPEKYRSLSELAQLRKGLASPKAARRKHWRGRLGDFLRDRAMGWHDQADWT